MVTNRDQALFGSRNGSASAVPPRPGPGDRDSDARGADAARWPEQAHGYLTLLLAAVGDCLQVAGRGDSARRDSERVVALAREVAELRHRAEVAERELDRRRDEVSRLRAERERARREREDVADALTRSMNKRLARRRPRRV